MNIFQVNRQDRGGVGKMALQLHQGYQKRGIRSEIRVAYKRCEENAFQLLDQGNGHLGERISHYLARLLVPLEKQSRQAARLRHLIEYSGQPKRLYAKLAGHEAFDYPATWRLLEQPSFRPDILHLHNLHGNYFDLRALPWLSQQMPILLTPHDSWLLTGHCSHFFDCNRWQNGCGLCPDLSIYPHILRDATAYNWQRKQNIYAQSRFYVSTPCNWLMQKIENSILQKGIAKARVINNGVNLEIFQPPVDRESLRAKLNIQGDTIVLLFTAIEIQSSMCKDYRTLADAVHIVADKIERDIIFIALGEDGPEQQNGKVRFRFVPYQTMPKAVAEYYQAADLYLHAAKSDTFPTVILEAMACGTPVIATAVGGIPEQIEEGVTGFLTPLADSESMAERILQLIGDDTLRQAMGRFAARIARKKFSAYRMIDNYIRWYEEIIEHWHNERNRSASYI